ncbi:DUF3883 domain-containing protein [Fibrivirga algicola]|uniref:DUF3883 domain-containing protein n=1 Tax=Fibrivirga algicola TaxID=2950420 RepID=A0ABX0QAE2_9BACT|nr:DUF3883 domain-containing protein [Fibrivirga algicola]NID08926.1 DUF3883 domain-containing protein [Fibrivirga algicola]
MNNLGQFIEEELKKRKNDYLSSPTYLLEHYNNEKGNVEAYNGRQLLEMLQNADDASETASVKKVSIKLVGNDLIISNNGEPFSEAGVRSIIYSNASPKTMQQNKIGQKGLGFRSILSWADEIIINSGETKLAFSENIAKAFLQNLISEHDEIASFIKENSKFEFPIATLRIPELLNVNESENVYNLFATEIIIKLKENIIDEVQMQILSIINKETLIFLNHIEIIEIESPDVNIIYKRHYKDKSFVTVESTNINTNVKEFRSWNIIRNKGIHKGKSYELAIAWNKDFKDSENVIFSYFKTKVRFPFPALLHGTFDLSPDRNELVNDTEGHNEFLITELANLLIETSLVIASNKTEVDYSAIKLLNIDFESIDSLLIQFGFKDIIQDKIKQSKIFPTVNDQYISYKPAPAFYKYPIATIFSGNRVNNLLKYSDDESVLKIISEFGICHYSIEHYLSLTSLYKNDCLKLAKLIFYFLNLNVYKSKLSASDFELAKQPPFLIDNENELIAWDTNIFIQPDDKQEFKLPKTLNISFLNSTLVKLLLAEFEKSDVDFIVSKLAVFKVKKYSFAEISETIIKHYNAKNNVTIGEVKELHLFLYQLFIREFKVKSLAPLGKHISTLTLASNNKIRNAREMYFGKYYGNGLTEKLYSFDKSKLLASQVEFGFDNEKQDLVIEYFKWLGIVFLPRYNKIVLSSSSEKYSDYKEYLLRNYDYRKPNDHGEIYTDYNHLIGLISWVSDITVGYFDDIKKIIDKAKPEIVFEWIKKDERLKKTLEENNEILPDTGAQLAIVSKKNFRQIKGMNFPSYTRWLFATSEWMPIESQDKKVKPDQCCLSKTITEDFSPFVEKPKIEALALATSLELPESTIENYFVLVGVHREISSFSVYALYDMLSSLPISDKEGKAARKIYREIISNFNENKIDINHPSYRLFINDGKMFCQKGSTYGYYSVNETYYIPTKTYGNNVLKLFPIAMIDSKQGPQKIEKLFGVKRLKDISFNLISEPVISTLNNEFQNEIDRFKGLVYVLRMSKDTNHDIANRLKRLKIILAQELQTSFNHNAISTEFELEAFEYITHKKRNTFYISVDKNLISLSQLHESNKFCQSVAEIFSTLIETEEYNDFIHDLYSKPEFNREPRLLNYLEKDDNIDIVSAKKQLDIIDDVSLLFWRALAISSSKNFKSKITNEHELDEFLRHTLKLNEEDINFTSTTEFFSRLNELINLDFIYKLFIKFKVDYKKFARYFTGIDFSILFMNRIEDLKILYHNEFASQVYSLLLYNSKAEKEKYFDLIDAYSSISYDSNIGFLNDIELYFTTIVVNDFSVTLKDKNSVFSIEEYIRDVLASLRVNEINIPELLLERRSIQALLLFNEIEEVVKQTNDFNKVIHYKQASSNNNQLKVRGKILDYDNYQSLAEKVLQGLDVIELKLRISKLLPTSDGEKSRNKHTNNHKNRNVRFNSKNEEQIGFIAELICFHKLIDQYGEENIKWVSENAYRAYPDKFITGEAGKGYDFELIDKGIVRFIEVKGSSNISEGIYMSKGEINKALNFPDKYDLLIVENPLSEEPYIRYIKSPFKFKKNETLFANEKLKVFNENYVIKFKWDE